jgi:hypothetical protein
MLLLVCTALTQADPVCDHCKCTETTIDCSSRNLDHHPDSSDWPTNRVVTDVLMDDNYIVHVTQYPPMAVRRLSLRNCKIVHIDNEAFRHLQNLTELDLSYNDITAANLNAAVFQVKTSFSRSICLLEFCVPFSNIVRYNKTCTASVLKGL